jgi:hypothetical protein
MEFFLNQVADVGTRITWTDKRFRRFLFDIRDLLDFQGEINNNWGMYSLYVHSNGRTIKEFVERLVQFGINIDSADRDLVAFPNPFQFNITFNGSKDSIQPIIQQKFKDIKYLKLETITLPDKYSISKETLTTNDDYDIIHTYFSINFTYLSNNDTHNITLTSSTVKIRIVSILISGSNWNINYIINDNPNTVYEMNQGSLYNKYYLNPNKKISNDRAFYVYIPEIRSQNFTTSLDGKDPVTFFVNCTGSSDNTLLNNIYPTFMFYKDSTLQNAQKYTVKITDRYGKVYKVENTDKNANVSSCDCTSDDINYSCRCSYIRNPYYVKLQVSLQFKFGIFFDDLYKDLLNPNPHQ